MFDISQPNEAAYPELVAAGDRSRRTMTRHLEALAADGAIEGDPGLIGHMFWSALHGPIMLAFSGKLVAGYDARRIIAASTEALSRGLFGPAARRPLKVSGPADRPRSPTPA
jgi:hypothetical protein